MTYRELLETSAKQVGNVVCMGLDVKPELLPHAEQGIRHRLNTYFQQLFRRMNLSGLLPAAFKPNIGYYAVLDNPREEEFSGSLALADLFDLLENFFPNIPIILDSKRGDIATSSRNYADEAFKRWRANAITVAPYMGSDSVGPFIQDSTFGTYILNRTSNPGGRICRTSSCTARFRSMKRWPSRSSPTMPGRGMSERWSGQPIRRS